MEKTNIVCFNKFNLIQPGNYLKTYCYLLLMLFICLPTAIIYSSEELTLPDSLKIGLNSSKIEEKIEAYSKVMDYYNRIKPEKSLEYGNQALQEAQKKRYRLGEGKILFLLGVCYHAQSNYTKAMDYYQLSYKIMKEQNNKEGIGRCLNRIGLIYNVLGKFDKAFEYCLQSISILEHANDKKALGESYNHLGILYYVLNDISKAKEASIKALEFCETINEALVLAVSHEHLGVIYIKTGEFNKALFHVKKSLELRETKNDKIGVAGSYENLAIIFKNQKKYNESISYYNKSFQLKKEVNNQRGMASSISGIGMIYFKTGNYEKSLSYILRAFEMRKKLGDKRGMAASLNLLAEIYSAKSDYKSAFNYYKQASVLSDSLINEKKNKDIAELQEKFQQTKRDKEILLLQRESTSQKYFRNSLLIITFLISITTVFIFIAYHSKRKVHDLLIISNQEVIKQKEELQFLNEQLQELNATKDKFFSIIAHDLKSPFLGFLGLTEMMVDENASLTQAELLDLSKDMHKSANSLFKLLQNLLAWSQMQKGTIILEPQKIILNNLVGTNIEIINQRAIQKGVNIINNITGTETVFADEKMIDAVMRNILSNAVKFSNKNGEIIIGAKEIGNGLIEIYISDNGIGMSKDLSEKLFKIGEKVGQIGTEGEPSTGLGLLLCKEFIEKNGGKIRVESKENKGSIFYFTLPTFT